MAEEAETKKTETETKTKAAPKTPEKSVATYSQEKPKTIKVKTNGQFALFDVTTGTHYMPGETKERSESDKFVVANLKNKKLKKVS